MTINRLTYIYIPHLGVDHQVDLIKGLRHGHYFTKCDKGCSYIDVNP